MKKIFLMWMLVFAAVVSFSSCSDDDESKFDYPMDTLYGTWEVTEIMAGGTWYDVTKYPYDKFAMSISFKSDGTYYGSGYLGNGSGTYTAEGKTIVTYVSGEEYVRYTVKSLTSNTAELSMLMGEGSIDVKARKK